MSKPDKHKWIFPARFQTGAYSWQASRLACQRLREAVSEIKKVTKKDPLLGAEGAVRLMEKLWPALEHIDDSGSCRKAQLPWISLFLKLSDKPSSAEALNEAAENILTRIM